MFEKGLVKSSATIIQLKISFKTLLILMNSQNYAKKSKNYVKQELNNVTIAGDVTFYLLFCTQKESC